jgi:hypothetical protein
MATVETKLPNGVRFEARAPSTDEYDRLMGKLKAGQTAVGQREFVQLCAVSHSPEDASQLLAKYPGIIGPLATALDGLATGDASEAITTNESAATLHGITYRAPDLTEWEEWQGIIQTAKNSEFSERMRDLVVKLAGEQAPEARVFLTKFPGAAHVILTTVADLVGANAEIVVKKG